MSQLPTAGAPGDIIRDRSSATAPRTAITGELYAPGLAIPQPVSRGVVLAQQLAAAIGITGEVFDELGDQAERRRIEQEQLDAKNKETHKGLAQTHLGQYIPRLAAELSEGKHQIPKGMTIAEYTDQLIAGELVNDNFSAEYKELFRQRATEDVNRLLTDRAMRTRIEARDAILDTLSVRLDDRDLTTEGAAAVWAEAKRVAPELSEAQLYDKVIRPARDRAVDTGDPYLFPIVYKALPEQLQGDKLSYQLRAEARRRELDESAANATRNELFRRSREGASLPALLDDLERARTQNIIPHEEAGQIRQFFINRVQQRGANDLRASIFRGTAKPEDVEAILQRAVSLPEDDPFHLDPITAQGIRDFAAERQKVSVAKRQALFVLGGAPGNLTEIQHGTAIAELLGPDNAGYIDEANRIADPGRLATSLLHARIIPGQVRQTLIQAITSESPAEIADAAQVVGAIAVGNPRMYARLLDDAGPSLRPVLDAAAEQFGRGLLADPAKAKAAVEKIRTAQEAIQEIPRPSPQIVADLRRETRVDPTATLDRETDRILETVRDKHPHAKNYGIFHRDWLWGDPSLAAPNVNIRRRVEGWYTQRYAELQSRLPREEAIAEAKKYATAMVENTIDFVRWGDQVQPVLIDSGDGLALPPGLRWGQGFEEEARKDIAAAGFDPEDIASMRPLLNPITAPGEDPEAGMGWVYVNSRGDDIRDDRGRLIVFRPADKTRAENERLQALLAKKEAGSDAGQRAFRAAQNFYRQNPIESPLRAPFHATQDQLGPRN